MFKNGGWSLRYDGRSLRPETCHYNDSVPLQYFLIKFNTLIASMAYSTWNILPSGENVLTPLHLEHAHDTHRNYSEIVHTTIYASTRQAT